MKKSYDDLDISYRSCLMAAGATVHTMEFFGLYGGDWWAKVTYQGITGYCYGSYGSCSGCDHLEGWGYRQTAASEEVWQERMSGFAQSYLPPLTPYEAIAFLEKGKDEDSDLKEIYQWVLSNIQDVYPEIVMEHHL